MHRLQGIITSLLRGLLEVGILVVVCQFIFWTTLDFIFSEKLIDVGLAFLFWAMGAVMALLLTAVLVISFDRLHRIVQDMLLVLINVYIFRSLSSIFFTGPSCSEEIMLSYLYSEKVANIHSCVVVVLLLITGLLLIFKVLPRMKWQDVIIVGMASFIFLVDALYYLIGYDIFYPGNW